MKERLTESAENSGHGEAFKGLIRVTSAFLFSGHLAQLQCLCSAWDPASCTDSGRAARLPVSSCRSRICLESFLTVSCLYHTLPFS